MQSFSVGRSQPGAVHVEKDRPVLKFLWEWKVASTQAIALRFNSKWKHPGHTTYKRLARLERLGFVQRKIDEIACGWVWMLTATGFEAIRFTLPMLKEDGFASENIRHDRLVQAAHLGVHLRSDCKNVARCTEQQLRRLDQSAFPSWVPKDVSHRPDGYWNIPGAIDRSLIALEVEISRKTSANYVVAADFYGRTTLISSVLWILETASQSNGILASMKSGTDSHRSIHSFFLLDDLRNHGWEMKCIAGENPGRKFGDFLQRAHWEKNGKVLGNDWEKFPNGAFFENTISGSKLNM